MGLRLIVSPQSTNVVPLRPARKVHTAVDEEFPQPDQFGDVADVALLFHRLTANVPCESCHREGV